MHHILFNGSRIHLSHLPRQLFQQTKCSISARIMQLNQVDSYLEQCLPFLHASGFDFIHSFSSFLIEFFILDGKIQINPDGSATLEGHLFVINDIHCFLNNKISVQLQPINTNPSDSLDLHSGNISIRILSGNLIEQNAEGIM